MVFDLTSPEEKTLTEIDSILSSSYSFIERIKLGGIDSPRFEVIDASQDLIEYLKSEHYVTCANLEIRAGGILVHIDKGQRKYGWPIPFHQLSIFQSKDVTVHAKGSFLRFRGKDPFFKRLLALKADAQGASGNPNP